MSRGVGVWGTPRRTVAVIVIAMMVAAACGQKSGVAGSASGGRTVNGGAPRGGGDGTAPARHEPGPNNTAGVTDEEIVVGVHAPVTGAAPIPQTTFDVGKDIYWQFLAAREPDALGGRRVRIVFRDDEFEPRRAVQVCRELVEKENVFVLVGAAGADQITACARYADRVGVPYFSAGVNESGLAELSTYYALSLTYAEQAPLVAQQIKDLGLDKVGVVIEDTPSFQDAHIAFLEAADDAGLDVVVDDSIGKRASSAATLAEVQELSGAGAEVVFLLVSPLVYLSIATGAQGQGYDPVFIGPGITNGLNQVTEFGCPSVAKGQFFSPFPELDVIDQLDPDYLPAYAQFGGGRAADDIGLALWGLNKALRAVFGAAGEQLGRAEIMNAIEAGVELRTGVYPPVKITPDDHFGGTGAHLLQADCEIKQYITAEQFVEAPAARNE